LLNGGLVETLRNAGHGVNVRIAELNPEQWHAEIQSGFELMRMLAAGVREARQASRLPIVLAGNCNTAVGTVAGLGADRTGVAWFDAHGDFNTPETTTSGFLDGNAVAIITGRCWTQLAGTVPGFMPVADNRVCLVGTRDIDSLEGALLDESSVTVVLPPQLRDSLPAALQAVAEHVDDIYVHLDLDVLDVSVAAANSYAVGGGLTLEDMEYALARISSVFAISGIALTAYDPAADDNGAAREAAIHLIDTAARLASRS
jgi:arginase